MGKLTTEFTDSMCRSILAHFAEMERLQKLTNAELVAECAKLDAADYLVVLASQTGQALNLRPIRGALSSRK